MTNTAGRQPFAITAYNDEAVRLLQLGDLKGSHSLLQVVLGLVRDVTAERYDDELGAEAMQNEMKDCLRSSPVPWIDVQPINEGMFSVCNRAFLIPNDTLDDVGAAAPTDGVRAAPTIKDHRFPDVTAVLCITLLWFII
ncbi:hypothetical protein SEMRO_2527_G330320.1 [Seminavis robusta]|uniref:Uncharacterized protein n=1 Tax=Seminavis robusta TaxID=568900 RepID=A0A9N8F1H8_9STRA|nr:hypothetical protein SEMRO_2527_G330320.1 [Seminavis robusta]|eukprot:Sro2527_g330320.1 n/a (139) ;mRNA; f:12028-12444